MRKIGRVSWPPARGSFLFIFTRYRYPYFFSHLSCPCRNHLLSWNHIPLRGPTKAFFKYYTIFYYYCQIGNPLPSRAAIIEAFFKYYTIFFNKSQMRERVLVLWENSHMGWRLLEVQKNSHMGYRSGFRLASPAREPLHLSYIGKIWLDWQNLEIAAKFCKYGKKWKLRPARAQSGGANVNKSIIICKQIIFV